MYKIARLGRISINGQVVQFLGKTIEEAIENAEKSGMNLVSYFEQPAIGKSKFRAILCEIKGE